MDDAVTENAMSAMLSSLSDEAMASWMAACAALVTAEQSGLPEADLEELADEVISCKLRLAKERALGNEKRMTTPADGPEQLMLEGMSTGS
jgi:hypothetical protein